MERTYLSTFKTKTIATTIKLFDLLLNSCSFQYELRVDLEPKSEPEPVPALAEAGARPEAAREVGGWHKNGLKRKKKSSLNEKWRKRKVGFEQKN